MNIGFKDRRTAVALKQSLLPGQALVEDGLRRATEGYLFKTGAGGIPAMTTASGVSTAGKATCTLYYIDETDKLVTFKDEADAVITRTVWNVASDAVAANAYIQAKTVFGKLVVDWEQCD